MSVEKAGGFLTRSRLRDTVFVLAVTCALFSRPTYTEIAVALVLLVVGNFVHFLTKGVLIRNEVLCREGIYSIVRHPYYLANFLIDCCFCMLSGSHYFVLFYPFLFFWAYGPTMQKEERNLAKRYNEAFLSYVLETPRVFPDRQSIRNIGSLFVGYSAKRISAKEMARIVRFCAMAILILSIGKLSEVGSFGTGLLQCPGTDILLVSAVLLYVGSGIIMRIKRHRVQEETSLSP